jgi:hypothetical protein
MKKHKILIQLFPLVTDIDLLERCLLLLKQNSLYIDFNKFHIILDVTLPVNEYLVDWNASTIKKDFFIDKFNNLKQYGLWAQECYFNIDESILGGADCSINNIYKYNVDDIIWLDSDIIFNQYTLGLILNASFNLKSNHTRYIITPEFVKLGDNTWDILVNENFLNKTYGYQLYNDSIIDSHNTYGDMILEPLINNNNNVFKFGGGWFTLFSKDLLNYIEFPNDIKGYCPIDTFIMMVCPYIPEAVQYKIKNLIVCEDRTYLSNSLYKKYVNLLDKRNDPELNSWDKLISHKEKIIKKNELK